MNTHEQAKEKLIVAHEHDILDATSERSFDDIVALARQICQTSIAAIAFVKGNKQCLIARDGIDIEEIELNESFCSTTITERKFFQIEDDQQDPRFNDFRIVKEEPHIRFYAGVPLVSQTGEVFGTLCVLDKKTKRLTTEQQTGLERLARYVVAQLELRQTVKRLQASTEQLRQLEEELGAQREEYKRIVDSATDMIYEIDLDGKITFFNPATLRIFEYTESEILGHLYLDLIQPEYRFTVQRFYNVQVARQTPVTYYEVPAVTKTGKLIWLGQNVTLKTKEGVLQGFSVVARDITERKQVEIALREGQERYQTIIENAAEGIYMTDPETRRVIDANPAFARIVEYSVEELRGLSVYDLVVDLPENIDRRMENLHRLRNPIRIDRTYRTRTGKEVFVEDAVSVVMLNGKETLVTMVHDVTQRKEAEAKLLASEQRFRELFTKIPLPSWVCDLETLKFLEVNEAAIKHYGYSREEFLSMRISDIRPNRSVSQLQIAHELIQTRQSSKNVSKHRLKNGTIIDVESTWHEIDFDGRKSILVVVRDVTELKRAQEELEHSKQMAEQASKAKSEFLANMSHEIRTPMNGILATIELLNQTPLTDEQRDYLETIQVSGDALMKIINNILDFSRLEAGDIQAEQKELLFDPFLEELFEIVAIQAEQKGLEMHYWIDDDVPPTILTDVTRLRQILLNLLTNAVKFTEKGGVIVTVARGVDKSDRMGLLFSVRDTGPGIPKERIDTIFQPFTQIDSSMTRKYGGLGLGLTICKRSVELLGGYLWIESVVGEGTSVRFDIRTGNPPSTPGAPSDVDIFKGHRILLASDNSIQKQIVKRLLESWGCVVTVASSAQELLTLGAKEKPYEVLIMNHQLGDALSINLFSTLQKYNGWEQTKAVLLVPHGKHEYGRTDSNLVFLRKPLRHRLLLDTLQSFFVAHSEKKSVKKTSHTVQESTKNELSILVAEDNTINQKLVLRILKSLGYEGDIAQTGKEAVEKVKAKKYDIVFMDVQMPEMDGFQATKAIIESLPNDQRPVIVAMTAHALQGDKERCLEAGMDDYLSKPLLIDDVRRCIERWNKKFRGE